MLQTSLKLQVFMRILICLVFCLLGGNLIFSQDEVPFKLKSQFYLKGDAFYIGNNILSENKKKPYTSFAVINDQINMQYIDVDSDGSTFSSSKASYNLKDPNARIVSATLYWSGVYPFAKGSRVVNKDRYEYKKSSDRDGDYTQVKLKTPSSKDYQNVNGNVLFDGIDNKNYKDNAPYVCYADVTHLMSKNSNGNGEYSVANVKGTRGFVSGGSTAGWFLFVVYESDLQEERYITTFNGFSSLSDNSIDIEFKDFKTRNTGKSNPTIFVATLEGDSKLSRDQCGIFNTETKTVQYLNNKLRAKLNFFNGKMTIDNRYFTNRTPNGPNTLGFDVLKLKLPTNLIKKNQTSTTLRLESRADRFYFYFTAFKTEISKTFFEEKTEKLVIEKVRDTLVVETKPKEENPIEILTKEEEEDFDKLVNSKHLEIPGLEPGFYIITNVFSIKSNADNWKEFLESKGHEAKIFKNPENNWYYVHSYNDIDVFKVYKKHQKLAKLDYFKEIWVFKIN